MDISNLATPKLVGSLSLENAHQIAVSGNYVHVLYSNDSIWFGDFIRVIDVSNPATPVQVGQYGNISLTSLLYSR